MKITEIVINERGVWRNLHLRLPSSEMSVFYGPNEAGKTTLMKFVREMLFGFDAHKTTGEVAAGSITLSTEDGDYVIRRTRDNETYLTGPDGAPAGPDKIDELLSGVDENVFQNIFAIGIGELQELSTLHEREVADRIYGLTLGPRSKRILEALEFCELELQELADDDGKRGKLIELFERHDRLQSQLKQLDGVKQEYIRLANQRKISQEEISEIQSRQSGIDSQLRGHLYMQRAWKPWRAVEECREELASLPIIESFPENGLERLQEIELELAEAAEQRDRLKTEAKALIEDSNRSDSDRAVAKYESILQGLVDHRDWIADLTVQIQGAESHRNTLSEDLAQSLRKLGGDWSTDQLEQLDTSPAAYRRLIGKGRAYQAAVARREKLKQSCKRLSNSQERRQVQLAERTRHLGVESISSGLEVAQSRLSDLETLSELKLKKRELHRRQLGIDELREHTEVRMSPPPRFYLIFWFLVGCGLISLIAGVYNGIYQQWLTGGIFAAFCLMSLALGQLAKHHFEHGVERRISQLNDVADRNREELRATREELLRLMDDDTSVDHESDTVVLELAAIRECSREIAELESLAIAEQKMERNRARLKRANDKLYQSQRDVAGARQVWQQTLTHLGLPETFDVNEAFEFWQSLVETDDLRRQGAFAELALKGHREVYDSFCRRIAEVARRMHQWDFDFEQPLTIVDHWEQQLKQLHSNRKERQRLRREAKARFRDAAEYRGFVDECKSKRAALLVQGGAANSEEFEYRANAATRRVLLEHQLEQARQDLEAAGQTETELAVTEEDLQLFDQEHNQECIELLKLEQEDLQKDLQAAYEKLGGVKREIEVLEADRQSRMLRRELEQIRREMRAAAGEWFSLQRAKQAVVQLCHEAERTHQPVVIADASRYLVQITCGKYRNIWTPLGKRHLRIEDEQGQSLAVEKLSRGTREQLFLAIRLALIHDFARNGVALPVVLDDVLVNYDEQRTTATVQALIEFASSGHQLLMFTCHRHLAEIVQSQGQEPLHLPGHDAIAEAA